MACIRGNKHLLCQCQCLVPVIQLVSIAFAFSSLETNSKLSSDGNRSTVEEFLCPPSSEASISKGESSIPVKEIFSCVVDVEITAVWNHRKTWVAVFIEHILFVAAMMTSGGNSFILHLSGNAFFALVAVIDSSLRIRFVMIEISAVVIPERSRPSGWISTLCILSSSNMLTTLVRPFSKIDSGIAEVIIRENSPRLLKLYLLWLCKYDEYCATTCPEEGCLVDRPFSCIWSHDPDENEWS